MCASSSNPSITHQLVVLTNVHQESFTFSSRESGGSVKCTVLFFHWPPWAVCIPSFLWLKRSPASH
eukprot:10111131-Prorocentrum_lima.AAC.1